MIIGITGSSGFIGRAVFSEIKNAGFVPVALDKYVWNSSSAPAHRPIEKLDWVLHIGASTSIDSALNDPVGTYTNNLGSTLLALDLARELSARFLFVSSFVYGQVRSVPVSEEHVITATNAYMGSKIIGENICFQYYDLYNIPITVVRPFTVYGPGQKGIQFIPTIINAIRDGETIKVNDPSAVRDYLHITDLCRLIKIIVMQDRRDGFDTFNAGGGVPYKNIEVVKIANELATKSVPIEIIGKPRMNDVRECYSDIRKAKETFDWEPSLDLVAGLRECLEQAPK